MNKLGFGFLRLPRLDAQDENSIDWDLLNQMVDAFLAEGGTYFDTAYTYLKVSVKKPSVNAWFSGIPGSLFK